MTTIHVPYVCTKCKHKFEMTMKAGEPIVSTKCPKCDSVSTSASDAGKI